MTGLRAVQAAVRTLTQSTSHEIQGQVVREQALLTRLMVGVNASVGRTQGGATIPSERNALNLGAFQVYEDITGQIASMLDTATGQVADRDPRVALLRWYDAFELAWHRGQLVQKQLDVAAHRLESFAKRIQDLFDPATPGELIGSCPRCGEAHWFIDSKGTKTTALYSLRRPGSVEVRCHWCPAHWEGEPGLLALSLEMSDTPETTEDLHTAP